MRAAVTLMTALSLYPGNRGLAVKLLCRVVVLTVTTKAYLTFEKSVCVTKNCNT